MSSLIEMIRQIARNEIEKLHTLELGVVETVNLHETEDDVVNYDCSVLLKGRTTKEGTPLKLENVPIATAHSGSVIIPYVNDLVLISFINGIFSMPVIIGRLYSVEKRTPLYGDGEHRITFDPNVYRQGDKDTSRGEPLLDRRIIEFRGMPKKGEFMHDYLIRFNAGTVVRYDESIVDIVTNFLPKEGEDSEPSDFVSHMRLRGVGEKEAELVLETGKTDSQPSSLLGKTASKISEMVLGSSDKMASISIHTKDEDRSTILLERGESSIEIDTEKPSGKNKATITVRSGKAVVRIKQDGNIEIDSPQEISIISAKKMTIATEDELEISAKKDIKMKSGQKLDMESKMDTSIKAGAGFACESKANLELKAGAMGKFETAAPMELKSGATGKLEAAAILEVKGALVKIN